MSWAAALVLASAGTFAIRFASSAGLGALQLSVRGQRILRHAAIGILAAMAVSTLPADATGSAIPSVVALAATGLALTRTKNLAVAMAVGVAGYWMVGLVA